MNTTPRTATVLQTLPLDRLFVMGRLFGTRLYPSKKQKRREVASFLATKLGDNVLPELLCELMRDELRAVCRAHGLPAKSPSRDALIAIIAKASGFRSEQALETPVADGVPLVGKVLAARGRQWLIEKVTLGNGHRESPLLTLACLDDDAPGRTLEILWDLEVGARVIEPAADGLGVPEHFDAPTHFGAYLHALKSPAPSGR